MQGLKYTALSCEVIVNFAYFCNTIAKGKGELSAMELKPKFGSFEFIYVIYFKDI